MPCRTRGSNWVLIFCGYTCFKLKFLQFNRNLTRPEPAKKTNESRQIYMYILQHYVTPGNVEGKNTCSHKWKVRSQT